MRTVRTKVYKFNELMPDVQAKVIDSHREINVDFEWWEFTYDDANEIGLEITGHDLYHGTIEGRLNESLTECCNLVLANHGEQAETYKTAKAYLAEWGKLVAECSDGIHKDKVCEDKESEFDEAADELEKQLKLSLLEDYLKMLRDEYEYQTSDKAIIETINANQYEFTANGKRF